jgi:hypothetical protein
MQVRRRRAISLCKQMLIRSFTELTATASLLKGRVHEGVRSQSAKR